MRVLLDTCVLSELNKATGSESVLRQVMALDEQQVFISAVTIGEIAKGISLLDSGIRQESLQAWLNGIESQFADHVLDVDCSIARIWGELTARAQKNGRVVNAADGIIAATAIRHGCHVMTRNVYDFEPTGVLLINPWDAD